MTLRIPLAVYLQLQTYVMIAPGEISGLGTIVPHDQGWQVKKIYLLAQKAGTFYTTLSGEAVTRLLMQMIQDGEDPAELCFWWHSHGHEPVFWSDVDEATIERFQNDGMISLVLNKKGEMLSRRDTYVPRHIREDIQVTLLLDEPQNYLDWYGDLRRQIQEATMPEG